jgi:hypothetical protein
MSSMTTKSTSPSTFEPPRLCSIYARDVASLLKRPQLAGFRLASANWAYIVDRFAAANKLPRYSLELVIRKTEVK